MYIRRTSAVNTNITFRSLRAQAEEVALIDSGATENFIHEETWKKMGIGKQATARPMTVYNVDGSENKTGEITHYCWLRIVFKGRQRLQKFYIASLGRESIILGYPFLYVFTPEVDWKAGKLLEGEVSLQNPRYKYRIRDVLKIQKEALAKVGVPKEGEAIYMRRNIAQDWAHQASEQEIKLMEEMIPEEYQRHAKVFSEQELKRFPPAREEDMRITLKPDAPEVINTKIFPLSREERKLLEQFLATELELGRIKEGPSPYTAPVYFINKKDSKEKCIIMDYREVNKVTVRDNNPLPNIREMLENFRGKKLFSKFDIRWGYNNIRIKEEDQYKAAFKTAYGTFIPKVMYFGLMNAPPFFQRTMHRDFRELLQRYPENLGNYMDDWWIATDSTPQGQELHKKIVHEFLDLMEEKSYFLKASKTQFEKPQMEILGWQVGGDGIRIDPSKVAGIAQWPRQLKNVKQVRSTLGVLGYQRPFIRNFAAIAKPLHDLTKKDAPFLWTEECREALDKLIKAVTSEAVLYQPDFTKQFELEVDASLFAVGAVLFQRDEEGRRRPVSYYSAALNSAERNYDIWDREFLAMIKGLKHNRHLLIGSPHKVIVLTDHENLGHYRHPQKINRRVARYLHTLADFDLELRHIPGATNKADALSRRPDHDDGAADNEEITALPDSLFARVIDIGQEWLWAYKCQEIDGTLFKDGALVVTGGEDVRRSILQRYHDALTAGHP